MTDKLHNLLKTFEGAFSRFEDALNQAPNEYIRDSAIQRFEFVFELFWKILKAYSERAGLRAFSPRDALRSGFQLGIISEEEDWFQMLEDRNLTSHTYNEATAELIYAHLPRYFAMMREAIDEIQRQI